MKFKSVLIISLLCVFSISVFITHAQVSTFTCNHFKRKGCKRKVNMGNYNTNGQLLVAPLVPGESAELSMTFYRGHDYRVILCGEEHLGKLEFKIMDSRGNELFNNKDFEMTQDWDFSMTTTKRLIIVAGASGKTTTGQAAEEGCVNLIVGNRKTPKTGFY